MKNIHRAMGLVLLMGVQQIMAETPVAPAAVLPAETMTVQPAVETPVESMLAQPAASSPKGKEPFRDIDANFLSGYYQQDGNNSPVTGGIGTEKLNDFSNVFIINVPLDSVNAISLLAGSDTYTSASTDNIDSNVSSASYQDTRNYGTLGYTRKNLKRSSSWGVRGGVSREYDYQSFSTGISYNKEWNNGNTGLNLTGQAFFDKWLGKEHSNQLIYPELWLGDFLGYAMHSDPKRHSYNASLFLSQTLSRRLQIGVSAELIYMTGLLSTPFHSVYFADKEEFAFDIERLPSSRLKIPLGIRLNYFPFDFLVLRAFYRYYTDDFGIAAHSWNIETPLKLSNEWTLSPFYRFHTQTAATYFAPYKTHTSNQQYYTSDYDLSAMETQRIGMGVKYYPNEAILRSPRSFDFIGIFQFKYVELRGAYYTRSTDLKAFVSADPSQSKGLQAFNVSLNLGFGIKY